MNLVNLCINFFKQNKNVFIFNVAVPIFFFLHNVMFDFRILSRFEKHAVLFFVRLLFVI